MTDNLTTRSFLACWPDPEVCRQLGKLAGRLSTGWGGRPVRSENLHLTLAFLGELTQAQADVAIECCVAAPRLFRLRLDRLSFRRRNGIVWTGTRREDDGFTLFVEGIRINLRRSGFRIDARRFVPHVTLLRKATRRPRLAFEHIPWVIDSYSLMASRLTAEGARYSESKRWSTQGDME